MDACGNRFAITRSRPHAYYYYAPEKGERTRNPKAYLPPRCVNHVPGLFCKRSPRLLILGADIGYVPTFSPEHDLMPNSTRAHRVDDRVDRKVVVLERDNVRSLLYFAFARAGL